MSTGSAIIALSTGAHLAAGGSLPQPAVMAALAAVTLIPVAALSRRWLSFPLLMLLLFLGQVWLHWSFNMLGSQHGVSTARGLLHHAGHYAVASAVDSASTAGQFLSMSWPMFFGHVLATVAGAALLSRGESLLKATRTGLRGRSCEQVLPISA